MGVTLDDYGVIWVTQTGGILLEHLMGPLCECSQHGFYNHDSVQFPSQTVFLETRCPAESHGISWSRFHNVVCACVNSQSTVGSFPMQEEERAFA